MARVNATTNGQGLRLYGGLDLHGLKTVKVFGKRLDPWELIKNATNKRRFGFKDFFREDSNGDLVYPELAKYNLLARHVQKELGIKGAHPWVEVSSSGGTKLIEVNGSRFLNHAGKIYRHRSEWENEQ